jgi:hypothetical protein
LKGRSHLTCNVQPSNVQHFLIPMLKRRCRTVSFRLTDEEYEAMMASCTAHGSRSLSEFARSVAGESASLMGNASIPMLRNRVSELDRMVRNLTRKLAHSSAGGE